MTFLCAGRNDLSPVFLTGARKFVPPWRGYGGIYLLHVSIHVYYMTAVLLRGGHSEQFLFTSVLHVQPGEPSKRNLYCVCVCIYYMYVCIHAHIFIKL